MKFSIVANTKQENIREILKKVIGFVEDFELDKVTAKFLGLSGVEIKDLSGEVIISPVSYTHLTLPTIYSV